jgi:sulfotransferase
MRIAWHKLGMKLHTVCGTPRSGSTLLCNVLNQNPLFHASSASCVANTTRALSNLWSNSPEVKSDLIDDKEAAEKRMRGAVRALIEAWYHDRCNGLVSDKERVQSETGEWTTIVHPPKKAKVIFDKGRLWNHQAPALKHVFPEAHMFVCVRDPRDILASIEKQHAKNPLLDTASSPQELTLVKRVESHCEPTGMVGQQIDGIFDLVERKLPFVHTIDFDALVRHPQRVMDMIYEAIGEEPFEHDFVDIKNTAPDVDGLYHNKFPHEGNGP